MVVRIGQSCSRLSFAEFSQSRLPERMHEAVVEDALGDALIGHVSRDPTAIEGREKPAPKPTAETPKRKRGRPRKSEEKPEQSDRLERQVNGMGLSEMLKDLPKACDHGAKKNAYPEILGAPVPDNQQACQIYPITDTRK